MATPWQNKPRQAFVDWACRGQIVLFLLLFSLFVITSYNEQIHEYICRK